MSALDNTRPTEEQRLKHMFYNSGMSVPEIASALNTTQKEVKSALDRYGIKRVGKKNKAHFSTDRQGYERLRSTNRQVKVHQLLVINEGADPHDVFSDDAAVHHKNRIPWDNRPENLELMNRSDHIKHHWENGDFSGEMMRQYDDEEMLDWIRMYVHEFGHVPTINMLDGWPGPTVEAYRYRFGSWKEALNLAGWKIPSHRTDSKGRRIGYEDPKPVDGGDA